MLHSLIYDTPYRRYVVHFEAFTSDTDHFASEVGDIPTITQNMNCDAHSIRIPITQSQIGTLAKT